MTVVESPEDAAHRRELTKYDQDHRFTIEKLTQQHRLALEAWMLKALGATVLVGVGIATWMAYSAPDLDVRKSSASAVTAIITGVITGVLGFLAGRGSK